MVVRAVRAEVVRGEEVVALAAEAWVVAARGEEAVDVRVAVVAEAVERVGAAADDRGVVGADGVAAVRVAAVRVVAVRVVAAAVKDVNER